MKIYNDVLNNETIQAVRVETDKAFSEDTWRLAAFSWPAYLRVGLLTGPGCRVVSPELASSIEGQIKHLLPSYEKLGQQIYVWPPGSGIAVHNDGNYKFGVTIYLNDTWDLNYGGLFIWGDKATSELKVRMPEFNSLVLNDDEEQHLVTPVALGSPVLRHTLQIWGL